MTLNDRFHRLFPKVVPVGEPCLVHIVPLYGHVLPPEGAVPSAEVVGRDTRVRRPADVGIAAPGLTVGFTPDCEQEMALIVTWRRGAETVRRDEFHVYAVQRDLLPLRPWKGDVHMHSSASDGREAPAYVAAACRRIGLDFMALTDHRRYQPSLDAQAAFSDLDLEFRIYPGEEVHPPDNPIHIVNFGGSFSVNAKFEPREDYDRAVDEVAARLRVEVPTHELRHYASAVWSFEQIRRGGGIGILCHPYWITGDAYNISEALQAALYAYRPFDALEVIGGFFRHQMESNALQAARWQEERSRGRAMPVVGVSDAHGCERGELFGWYYSIVFAPSAGFADLREAILADRSVAVEAVAGEFPRLFGPFRLVKLAYFLLREVFPQHDAACAPEGELMLRHLAGDRAAAAALAARRGAVGDLYSTLWPVGA